MNSRLRDWSRRSFLDPEPVLRALRSVELDPSLHELPDAVRRLRTNPLKTDRETRDALIFAHGMAAVLGTKVLVAPGEVEDCDFVSHFRIGDTDHFSCVQLKELAPNDLNPDQTMDALLAKLEKLPPSDAVLAIHLNRRVRIELSELTASHLPFAEAWYFWAADPGLVSWRIYGDTMKSPSLHEFHYPQ